ncbi:sugar phosphate isomerase/epimerase family protein [Glycomyces buryatensis]|uniref:Sugar phosphate isomerase/epimerase n=1 Tax=Glycomyces buryatensis TaxID=2570927 RepID=A0A4V4HSN2_9ACTN|nr:sugar phosphate isomerase/epimerase family protein [Glycomyces buryatensis]THV42326.1 sugar phosphate isomerase/epimerase [Glycomyces buryatensis]
MTDILERFSFNHATAKFWDQREAIDACARTGSAIGLWREPVAEQGLASTAEYLQDAGVPVTSLCRAGFFTDPTPEAIEDNKRAIDETAALGAPTLVLVSGPIPEAGTIDSAREGVKEALSLLAPYAIEQGVTLAIEPLHPMFASDRCVVTTLAEALDLAAPFAPEAVGVVIDTYHLWWDPEVWNGITRAGAEGRIASFQLADWITPLPAGVLTGRGQLGDGCIDMRRYLDAVDATGFTGKIEVELFNDALWARPGQEVFDETRAAFEGVLTKAARA